MSGHVVLEPGAESEAVRRRVDALVRQKLKIGHTTVQTETQDLEASEPPF